MGGFTQSAVIKELIIRAFGQLFFKDQNLKTQMHLPSPRTIRHRSAARGAFLNVRVSRSRHSRTKGTRSLLTALVCTIPRCLRLSPSLNPTPESLQAPQTQTYLSILACRLEAMATRLGWAAAGPPGAGFPAPSSPGGLAGGSWKLPSP